MTQGATRPLATEAALKAAFAAGFKSSGEGWNGEYPHRGDEVAVWLEQAAQEYAASVLGEAAVA